MEESKVHFFLYLVAVVGLAAVSSGLPNVNATTDGTDRDLNATAIRRATTPFNDSSASGSLVSSPATPATSSAARPTVSSSAPSRTTANSTKGTAECFLSKWEAGLMAVVLGGVLILCVGLLVTAVALGSQLCHLKRQRRSGCLARTNADLLSGLGYWGTDQEGTRGTETSVMLKEVKPVVGEEEEKETEKMAEAKADIAQGATGNSGNGEAARVSATKETNDVPSTGVALEPAAASTPPAGGNPASAPAITPTSESASGKV